MTGPFSTAAPDDATPPRSSTRMLAVGVLLIVFVAGVLGGIALERTVLGGHEDGRGFFRGERRQGPRRPSDMLGANLKLSEDQRVRVDTVIERQMKGFRDIRKTTQPAIDSLMAQTRRAIDSILTPEQRAQLDSARARREAEFRKRYPNGTPRGGPGDWPRGQMRRP